MKKYFGSALIGILISLSAAMPVYASDDAVVAWQCKLGAESEALQLIYMPHSVYQGISYSGDYLIRINSTQLCKQLGTTGTCPETDLARTKEEYSDPYNRLGKQADYFYSTVATEGSQGDGALAFYSDSGGMELVAINIDSGSFDFNRNWFFQPGECQKF